MLQSSSISQMQLGHNEGQMVMLDSTIYTVLYIFKSLFLFFTELQHPYCYHNLKKKTVIQCIELKQ